MADIKAPSWFNAEKYLSNKLLQLQAIDSKGGWTDVKLAEVLEENGYKGDDGAYKHFIDFGMGENVSPNAQFDAVFYLRAKADQLNTIMQDGKSDWSVVNVLDAINAAGMNVWEHYVNFGSQEGIAASAGFDSTKYVIEKTKLMNETKEGGRANWTVAEVQAAFAENGLSALEHYNLFGQAEFKAAGKEIGNIAASEPTAQANGFHLYNGAQEYNLVGALAAHANGSLSAKYMLTDLASSDVDAGNVTVAQQATLKAFIAAAENGADYAKSTVTYDLEDTVANIDAASGTVKANADTVNIKDTLANVVAGDDALVNEVATATGTVVFGAKAAADEKPADVFTTTVNFADLDGKTKAINIVNADDSHKGDAVVAVDASAEKDAATIDLSTIFGSAAEHVTFNAIGTDKADTITAHAKGGVIIGGGAIDTITLGNGADIIAYTAKDFDALKAESGSVNSTEASKLPTVGGDVITNFAVASDDFQFSKAIQALLADKGGEVTTNWFKAHSFTDTSNPELTAGSGPRFIYDGTTKVLYLDVEGDTAQAAGSGGAGAISNATDDIIIATGIADLTAADILFA